MNYRGKTALITGASSGIGEAFARALAERGTNVILVARSETKLQNLAAEMSAKYGIRAEVIVSDLSQAEAVKALVGEVQARHLTVDMLVNNAGFATYGRFEALAPERERSELMLNVVAVTDLTHAFLPAMAARGDGAVINVASLTAFQPNPYMATYGATKAFVLSFTEALWAENRRTGVRVLALCPGRTTSNFDAAAGTEAGGGTSSFTSPERVVQEGLRALERGRSYVLTGGAGNRVLALVPRVLPRETTVQLAERLYRPKPPTSQRNAAEKAVSRRNNA